MGEQTLVWYYIEQSEKGTWDVIMGEVSTSVSLEKIAWDMDQERAKEVRNHYVKVERGVNVYTERLRRR